MFFTSTKFNSARFHGLYRILIEFSYHPVMASRWATQEGHEEDFEHIFRRIRQERLRRDVQKKEIMAATVPVDGANRFWQTKRDANEGACQKGTDLVSSFIPCKKKERHKNKTR